jgi:hypothetical protein
MRRVVSLLVCLAAVLPGTAFAANKACSFLTQADAEKIYGAPMKLMSASNPDVCHYQEVTAKPGALAPGSLSVAINQNNSAAAATASWNGVKEIRHLRDGEKNTKRLTGIGDEAWMTGNAEKGKMGVAAVIVRKGNSNFMLDSMVMEYRVSPDALIALAKKIAGQL